MTNPTRTLAKADRRSTSLRFTPTAWAKLLYLRDAGKTEIGGFGVAADNDLLLIEDIRLVDQECSALHVAFDDAAVAEFFDAEVDAGRRPAQFARVWIHTHPANSAQPSATDEATFARVFGSSDWALLFILARGGETYARLRYNVGPGTEVLVPVEVDYRGEFEASDFARWQAEYEAHVRFPPPLPPQRTSSQFADPAEEFDVLPRERPPAEWYDDWYAYSSDDTFQEGEYDHFRSF